MKSKCSTLPRGYFKLHNFQTGLSFPPPTYIPHHFFSLTPLPSLSLFMITSCLFWFLKEKEGKVKLLSHVWLFATPWTIAHQAPQSMGFSRQEYWNGLPFPSPEDLPNPGIKPTFPAFQADALQSEHWGSFLAPKCPLRCSHHFIPTMIPATEATALQRSSLLTGPPGFPDYHKPLPLTGQRESFLNVSSDHTLVTGSLCLMPGTQGPSWVSPLPSSTPSSTAWWRLSLRPDLPSSLWCESTSRYPLRPQILLPASNPKNLCASEFLHVLQEWHCSPLFSCPINHNVLGGEPRLIHHCILNTEDSAYV